MAIEIIYLPQAMLDLDYWIKTGSKNILKKIADLTRAIVENPFKGIGKPEPLKYHLSPKWSRRINLEHRYVYLFENNILYVYSLKDH